MDLPLLDYTSREKAKDCLGEKALGGAVIR
jgi:hypothetical protein